MCMCACMYLSALHTCLVSKGQKRASDPPDYIEVVVAAMWVLELNPDPQQEQQVPVGTQPPLQALYLYVRGHATPFK